MLGEINHGGVRERLRWVVPLVALVAVALVSAAGGGAAVQGGGGATDAVAVDPVLRFHLERSGRADAVVTVRTRADLRTVRRLGVRGTELRTLPMVLVRGLTPKKLALLQRSPAVLSVEFNRRHSLLMEDTTWITRARYAWEKSNSDGGLPGLDTTGRGIHIAVIDTGVDAAHEDMENVVEYCDATPITAVDPTRTGVHCTPWKPESGNQPYLSGTSPQVDCAAVTCDDNGHGTHVSGTIAGTGSASGGRAHPHSTIGIAPDAKLHVYSANAGASLFNFQILASYDDLIYKKEQGIYPTVAVSNSWGGGTGYSPNSAQSVAFKLAYFAGILSVFAAGNSGPEHNTTSGQCNNPFVVCAAATTKPDHPSMFSSRGRPSEPQDTNRNGAVTSADAQYDNHDIKLGRAYDVGVYRPRVSAPGVNINSAQANVADCRETGTVGTPEDAHARQCYVQFNGTSMATPHVSGVVALIAEAYHKGHDNKLPMPQIITEILERAAADFKLPGWESEEQGAGRVDAYAAVEYAKNYPNGMKEPNLGAATALYTNHPGAPSVVPEPNEGCTGTLSWTAPEIPLPSETEPSPVATERYGQHFIAVPEKADRLRITARWPLHPGANLYLRLWRPGVDPDTSEVKPGQQTRAMADQEATGLVFTGSSRFVDVRAPEATSASPAPPTIPSGLWTLRVYHRAGGAPAACDLGSDETPKQAEGFNYTLQVELPTAQRAPGASISNPPDGSTQSSRWVKVSGKAEMPDQWEGITNYEVRGTEVLTSVPDPDNRKVLHFHGNGHVVEDPREVSCTGDGATDVTACSGPFLLESDELSEKTAASWKVPSPLLNGGTDRNLVDPNWTWYLSSSTTVGGVMTVEWWGSCGGCDKDLGLSADWNIRLWADGTLKFQRRVTATPSAPNVAEKLEADVVLPEITANERFVLHVDPVFIDTQNATFVYYDSTSPCPTATGTAPCDSLVRMPVGATGLFGTGPGPSEVRVTDVHKGLRVAWNPDSTAEKYEIHRSDEPGYVPSKRTRTAVVTGETCTSPFNPTWATYNNDPGLCWTDPGGHVDRTYYYRVVSLRADGSRSAPSLLAYGMRTQYDRYVRLKVDRLYGPQFWEPVTKDSSSTKEWFHLWDTLELIAGPHRVEARSFSQGIGSAKDARMYNLAPDRN